MNNIVQEHQYAKPGSTIYTATILLRDIYWAATQDDNEALLISLDFRKAFDSVDHSWLYRVMYTMNFPSKFIQIIRALNSNATSKILINGFHTKNVTIKKGVRQGDPLSLYLFLLAVEPLVTVINQNFKIAGLGMERKRNIKCPSYADDITLTLQGSASVHEAFRIISKFSEASGLQLNQKKIHGLKINYMS